MALDVTAATRALETRGLFKSSGAVQVLRDINVSMA